jgi:tetratricopeptide (TPR) repeat protein
VRTDRLAEAEKRYEEALPLYRAIESRLGEANTLMSLGRLRAAQNRTAEAEEHFETARSLYLSIEEKIGLINCALFLSDLYREKNQPAEALREALTAFLIGSAIEGPDLKLLLSRLVFLRVKVGQAVLDSIAKAVVETFPVDAQGTLKEVFEMMRLALEEKPEPSPETPHTAVPAPEPTSASSNPPPN